MSIHYGQFCPIAKAAEVLGERWTILILRELLIGTTRFNDLQRALSQISPSLLTKRLNQLQDSGLVVRKNLPAQRRSEYHLTAAGRELLPVVTGLGEWGMKWARGQMSDDELDVELLMYDFSRRIDAAQLPGGQNVVQFSFIGLSKFARWWIVLEEGGGRELCLQDPGRDVDLQILSDLRTMTEIWAGDTEMRAAKKDGRMKLIGDPVLIRTMPSWLRIGMFAKTRPHAKAAKA
ncbi:MAG: winged helix-turn-helix transcriptional regulator [Chthoniobacterales bacterium]